MRRSCRDLLQTEVDESPSTQQRCQTPLQADPAEHAVHHM